MKIKFILVALGVIVVLGLGTWGFKMQKQKEVVNVVQEHVSVTSDAEFEKPFTIMAGDYVKYPDGMNIGVQEINDSRCKPDVQCIWAGELAANLFLNGGSFGQTTDIIRLSSANPQIINGYKFTLDSGTEASITIIVNAEPEKYKSSFLKCLPADVKSDDIVDASIAGYENGQPVGLYRVTVEQRLDILKATCNNDKLVDDKGVLITFYHLKGCWGNPPQDYQEIFSKQQDEIDKLKEKYTVIEMTCNPSGIPIQ